MYNSVRTRPALEERLESIISGAALMADSSCTRDERREKIVKQCNAVRQALQDLLTEYENNVSLLLVRLCLKHLCYGNVILLLQSHSAHKLVHKAIIFVIPLNRLLLIPTYGFCPETGLAAKSFHKHTNPKPMTVRKTAIKYVHICLCVCFTDRTFRAE